MKFDIVKICAGLIIVLALLMCSSVATETTWRHSGFELWGYDINFTDHNASNIHLLHADYLHGDCSNVSNLNASNLSSGEIPLAQIPTNLTGKNADTLDGYHGVELLSGNSSSGSYTGNDTVNRAIPHGLGVVPKVVLIRTDLGGYCLSIIEPGIVSFVDEAANTRAAVTTWDATNFYVGNAGHYLRSGNSNTNEFYWVAFT